MKTKKKLLVVLAVALLASLAVVGVASADTVKGSGTLTAEGSGVAIVHGHGQVTIHGHGIGVVYVKGADELAAHGNGHRRELANGVVRFTGWSGTITASGENLTVRMAGGHIHFEASGTGWVFLRGRGTYHTGHQRGVWSLTGTTITLAQ